MCINDETPVNYISVGYKSGVPLCYREQVARQPGVTLTIDDEVYEVVKSFTHPEGGHLMRIRKQKDVRQ